MSNPYLQIWGNGPRPLALLCPFLFPSALYEQLALPHLQDYTLYVPDYPGYGHAAELAGPYVIERYAEWAADLLRPYGPMPMMGYSMGGIVAQLLAAQEPGMVSRLMLACTYAHKPQTLIERGQGLAFAPLVKRLGPRGLARVMYAEIINMVRSRPKEIVRLKQLVEACRPEVIAENARSLFRVDTRPLLPQITQPTLVVAASADWVVPAYHARQLAKEIPRATLHILPDASHFAIYTHGPVFWTKLKDFLAEEERA
ncbi:MAG: alpha/beta hydrolase [Bacteroidetes bacterium]|nr:alpha/beta hydrolase [Bacteroidota bacterium]